MGTMTLKIIFIPNRIENNSSVIREELRRIIRITMLVLNFIPKLTPAIMDFLVPSCL